MGLEQTSIVSCSLMIISKYLKSHFYYFLYSLYFAHCDHFRSFKTLIFQVSTLGKVA